MTSQQIRHDYEAYKHKKLANHPDRGGSHEIFVKIGQAQAVLCGERWEVTSDEINRLRGEFIRPIGPDVPSDHKRFLEDVGYAQSYWLREIAHQLAVHNEREAERHVENKKMHPGTSMKHDRMVAVIEAFTEPLADAQQGKRDAVSERGGFPPVASFPEPARMSVEEWNNLQQGLFGSGPSTPEEWSATIEEGRRAYQESVAADPQPGKRDAVSNRDEIRGMGDFPSVPEAFTRTMGDLYVAASNLLLQKSQGTLTDSHWANLNVAVTSASHAAPKVAYEEWKRRLPSIGPRWSEDFLKGE